MHYIGMIKTFLPSNLMFVRGMARKAIRLQEIQLQPTSRTSNRRSEKIISQPAKSSISHGSREIVVDQRKLKQPVHHEINSSHTFDSLQLRNDVQKGLDSLGVSVPTIIQIQGIPLVLEGKNVFCAAQTGSGKTLVYAAPIVSMLRDSVEEGFIGRLSRPSALILAPSRELAEQILRVFKSFSSAAPFRSLGLIGQRQKKWKREYLKGLVDVVVATPDIIVKYHQRGHINFSDLKYLVFDEADTLFDENFRETTKSILNMCHFYENNLISSKKNVQCVLTVATLPPKVIFNGYKSFIHNLELCQSNLHKVLPNVKHIFVKTEQTKKIDLLLENLEKQLHKDLCKTVIFCNTSKTCNYVSIKLNEHKITHGKLHGNVPPKERTQNYEKFINGDFNLLVCTDVASRGLDASDVNLVINYDCPFNASDYIHRSGRTGRATEMHSGMGEVVTYITQNKEVLFAEKVQNAAEKNESLDGITSKKNSAKEVHKKEMKKYNESVDSAKIKKEVIAKKNERSTQKMKEKILLQRIKESRK